MTRWAKSDISHRSNPRARLGQVLANSRQQLARAVGFRHIFITACRPRLLLFATERVGGDRDNRNRTQGGIGFDPARHLVTVNARQLDIHQDKIGPLFRNGFKRLLSALGLCDFVVGGGKQIANDLAVILLVLHHQNALAHAVSTCRSTRTGIVNEKVEPLPTCDSSQTLPPCISTMRLEMASPKPVPPFLRVIALSAC